MVENHYYAADSELGYARLRRQSETMRVSSRVGLLNNVTRIPVVVRAVYSSEAQNISTHQIHEQIDVLNKDFRGQNSGVGKAPDAFKHLTADPLVEFALATRDPLGQQTDGIIRRKTSVLQFPNAPVSDGEYRSTVIDREPKQGAQGSVVWPHDEYLNVWVCDIAS